MKQIMMPLKWALFESRSCKLLEGVSQEVRGSPMEQYSEQNHTCIIFNIRKTDFISIMTYFAKQDHLQLIKVLKSYKLTYLTCRCLLTKSLFF